MAITIGDGNSVEATAIGSVRFITPAGNVVNLRRVLYAPLFFANLLSVYSATKAGATFVFEGNNCSVLSQGSRATDFSPANALAMWPRMTFFSTAMIAPRSSLLSSRNEVACSASCNHSLI